MLSITLKSHCDNVSIAKHTSHWRRAKTIFEGRHHVIDHTHDAPDHPGQRRRRISYSRWVSRDVRV